MVRYVRAVGIALLLWFEILGVAGGAAAQERERPHVYLIVVDGLDAEWLPRMARVAALRGSGACPVTYPEAVAVMPARTNPNHASLLTGAYPVAHGITGNKYWDRDPGSEAAALEEPDALEVETLFTVLETEAPAMRTAAIFGKAKLGRLFGGSPGRQSVPDVQWAPGAGGLGILPARASDDSSVMDVVMANLDPEPDLCVVNLPALDGACHAYGTASAEAHAALVAVDVEIERLIRALQSRGRWERSVVIISSDHGFADVRPAPGRRDLYLSFGGELARAGITGLRVVSDGGLNHVYVEDLSPTDGIAPEAVERLRAARELALDTSGVTEALYRLPVPGVAPAAMLSAAHPTWRIDHRRVGELVLISQPSVMFSDPPSARELALLGNHGGPAELGIPLVFCGGWAPLRRDGAPAIGRPSTPDVGATVLDWLGMRQARYIDGRSVDPEHLGRVIRFATTP